LTYYFKNLRAILFLFDNYIKSEETPGSMSWLIGVEHCEDYLEQVINRLAKEQLNNKKVMLEIFSYPVDDFIRKMNPSFAKFWESIGRYVLDGNGSIVFGEDQSSYFNAIQKKNEINSRMREEESSFLKRMGLIEEKQQNYFERMDKEIGEEYEKHEKKMKKLAYESHEVIPFIERDPHFAQVIAHEKPDIIILGFRHMPYLIKNCFPENDYALTCIPSSVLLRLDHKFVTL
jgi:uncharacterized protein YecA (UPF0149 family)